MTFKTCARTVLAVVNRTGSIRTVETKKSLKNNTNIVSVQQHMFWQYIMVQYIMVLNYFAYYIFYTRRRRAKVLKIFLFIFHNRYHRNVFEQQLRRVSKYHGRRVLFIVIPFFFFLSFGNQFFVAPPRPSPLSRVTSNRVRTRDVNMVYANKSRAVCSSVREGADVNNDIVGIVKFLKRGNNHIITHGRRRRRRVSHTRPRKHITPSGKKKTRTRHLYVYNIMRKG